MELHFNSDKAFARLDVLNRIQPISLLPNQRTVKSHMLIDQKKEEEGGGSGFHLPLPPPPPTTTKGNKFAEECLKINFMFSSFSEDFGLGWASFFVIGTSTSVNILADR